MLLRLKMESCTICFEKTSLIQLHSECNYCSSCILSWCQEQFSQISTKHSFQIHCLSKNCSQPLNPQHIIDKLDPKQSEHLQKTLTLSYLKATSDVLFCSKQGCNYAGFVSASQIDCKIPLVCELCDHSWERKTSDSTISRLKNFLYKEFITKKCPKCNMSIYKISGCSHMTCGYCKTQFTWTKVHYRGRLVILRILQGIVFYSSIKYRENIKAFAKRNKGAVRVLGEIVAVDLWIVVQGLYHAVILRQARSRDSQGKQAVMLFAHLSPFFVIGWLSRKYPNIAKRLFRAVAIEFTVGTLMFGIAILINIIQRAKDRRNRRRNGRR